MLNFAYLCANFPLTGILITINNNRFCMKKYLIILIMSIISFSGQAALIHQYNFNTGVTDLIGSDDGTLLNGANINAGLLTLDGNNDYVQFASYIIPTGNFSVSFYARQDSNQTNFVEMISQEGSRFYIGHSNSRVIRVADAWLNTTIPYPSDGAIHHYVVTSDTTIPETKLYIDGVLQNTVGLAVQATASGSATRLGRQFGSLSEYFHGVIDDLNIYDNALTASDVNFLFFGPPAIVPIFNYKFFILLMIGLIGFVGIKKMSFKLS